MTERDHDEPPTATKRQELRRFGALLPGAALVVLASLPIPFAPGSPWLFVPRTALIIMWMALLRLAIVAVVLRRPDSRLPVSAIGWHIGVGLGTIFSLCENGCDWLFLGARCPVICRAGVFW